MVSFQTWVIIGLVVLAISQYAYPQKTNEFISPVMSPVGDFIKDNNPFGGKGNIVEDNLCPDDYVPVCGNNGVTYDNICKATLADILEVTSGEC